MNVLDLTAKSRPAREPIGDMRDEALVRRLYAAGIASVIIDHDGAIVATYGPLSDLCEIIQMSVEMEGGPYHVLDLYESVLSLDRRAEMRARGIERVVY